MRLTLKTMQQNQVRYLMELRFDESEDIVEFKLKLVKDLYTRNKVKRLPVAFVRLQTDVARRLYHAYNPKRLLYDVSMLPVVEDHFWLTCMHAAADAINDCIDHSYLEPVDSDTEVVRMTSTGSDFCSTVYFLGNVFKELNASLRLNIPT